MRTVFWKSWLHSFIRNAYQKMGCPMPYDAIDNITSMRKRDLVLEKKRKKNRLLKTR